MIVVSQEGQPLGCHWAIILSKTVAVSLHVNFTSNLQVLSILHLFMYQVARTNNCFVGLRTIAIWWSLSPSPVVGINYKVNAWLELSLSYGFSPLWPVIFLFICQEVWKWGRCPTCFGLKTRAECPGQNVFWKWQESAFHGGPHLLCFLPRVCYNC